MLGAEMKTSLQVLPPDPAEACCPPRPKLRALAAKPYAKLFKALGDETRLEMIGLLAAAGSELCACDIESHFDLSQPTISHHLKILREAGLVTGERRGRGFTTRSTAPPSPGSPSSRGSSPADIFLLAISKIFNPGDVIMANESIREVVQERYGQAVKAAVSGERPLAAARRRSRARRREKSSAAGRIPSPAISTRRRRPRRSRPTLSPPRLAAETPRPSPSCARGDRARSRLRRRD